MTEQNQTQTGQQIEVAVARDIAILYQKSIVIILAHEQSTNLMYCTTYGATPEAKVAAHQLGMQCINLLCGPKIAEAFGTYFEDFRQRDAANFAYAADRALDTIRALHSAVLNGESMSRELVNMVYETVELLNKGAKPKGGENDARVGGKEDPKGRGGEKVEDSEETRDNPEVRSDEETGTEKG